MRIRKLTNILGPDINISLWIIAVAVLVIAYYNIVLGVSWSTAFGISDIP